MQPENIDELLLRALQEDVGAGDVTTEATIDEGAAATGYFKSKANGVIAGTEPAGRVFELVPPGAAVRWNVADGRSVEPGNIVGTVSGNARAILTGERTALNLLQRMSGIATATSRFVEAVDGTGAVILDTRKTVPGLRLLDKQAVRAGGGSNHRLGLYDMVLIKDNHIVSAGGFGKAITRARRLLDDRQEHRLKIEVEARTLEEVREVIRHWEATGDPDRILLDNMARMTPNGLVDTATLQEAVRLIDGRLETEASGNVSLETVRAIADTGVTFISTGSLTHSVTALDISLELTLDS